MNDQELYSDFSDKEAEEYKKEAKERWGDTETYKQSKERVKKMNKEDFAQVKERSEVLMKKLASQVGGDPKSELVQKLIEEHYAALRTFYDPNPEIYAGLAEKYVNDCRFKAYFEKYAVGLAQFMQDSMLYYIQVGISPFN